MGWMLLALLVVLTVVAPQTPAEARDTVRPGCMDKCGNISIPYPFGVGPGCSKDGFDLACDDTARWARLLVDDMEVADIFVSSGQLRAKALIGRDCYNRSGANTTTSTQAVDLKARPFTFSHTSNKFTVVGCDTVAVFGSTVGDVLFVGSCSSFCVTLQGVANGTCSGLGCCQASIPKGLKKFRSVIRSTYRYNQSWEFNRCGYAFMAEEEQYRFSSTDLSDTGFYRAFPIMLDWSIGNQTCQQVHSNLTAAGDYACRSEHSECVDSPSGVGYVCNCSAGYVGNPYLQQGCQDINECAESDRYPCKGICSNTPGNYTCSCPPGTSSPDPREERCVPVAGSSPAISLSAKLGIGFGAGFLMLLTASSWAYWGFQKRRLLQLKHNFFQQNGGLFLQQHISSHQGATAFRIFTEDELAKATNNFDENRVLGRGGHGTVYKGTLDDGREVAIKKSRTVDERQSKEFAREMLILSQINHRNIVKLLGCCLEVEVPMLVYEFVSNGTLFDCIHHKKAHHHATSLDTRLRIAAEAAEALAYLHCYASPPILHGDVKSSNILLNDNYVAKVSDFGASILAPLDKEQFATVLQGTCGYLDPEYLITCQLTDKSDVYSFGVVLVELITGKRALQFGGGPEEDKSLAMSFVSAYKENRLMQVLEAQLVNGGELGMLQQVAELANRCLRLKGEERPTMKTVAMMLQGLRGSEKHPWVLHSPEEVESLLSEAPGSANRNSTTEYLSLRKHAMLHIEAGR